ncbi:MAG TPA: RidA family protein [Thermoanaerobaculia bacterium]|jgi:enamine deaminase RidA (YjgF/YER057c/UK114 family)|nr:RidA family protein [Thermoanaerobaculia bacterium]
MISMLASYLLILVLGAPKSPPVRFVNPPGLAKSPRYSHVADVTRGRLILISGQVAQDANGNVVGVGDMAAQTRKVFENLNTALKAVGATYKDVVKLTSFIVDVSKNIETYREVRQEYLRGIAEPPTSTTVGVPALVRGEYLLEVEAIAVVP